MASSSGWATTNAGTIERFGLTLIRVMVGAVFIIHGWQKWTHVDGTLAFFHGLGIPTPAAYAAMAAELGCGVLLVLGLFTRLATIPIVITMVVAILKVHLAYGFTARDGKGFEFPLTLGIAALTLLFTGPGMLAADNFLFGRKR